MLTSALSTAAYVDPFDRICHGLGDEPRNYRPERSN